MAYDLEALGLGGNYEFSKPQKKKKNFLLDQISTVGGIGGGILGTLASPIAGTAAGGALGSALGEGLENLITGDKITKNVGKEAALGGIFAAGPIKLLKGGAALATGKGVQAASQAALTPLRQKAGQAALGAADNLAVKNFRLSPGQLNNFKSKFGEDAGQVIRKYGFQSADDIATKGIQPLQQQFDDAIGGIAGVTKENLQKNLMKRVEQLSKAGPTDSKALGKQLKGEVDAILKGKGDVIDANELNGIRRQFDELVNYTEKAANPARYGVNKRMADGIRETLQQADPSGSLKEVGKELNKVRQLSDIVSKQSQLGRGSLPLNIPTLLGGIAGGSAFGPAGLATAAGVAATNSNAGRRAAMAGVEKLGSKLATSGVTEQTKKGIAGRMIGGEMLDQSFENNAMSPNTTPNTNPASSIDMPGQYQNPTDLSSALTQGMGEQSPYGKANLLYDLQRDPSNAKEYIQYYKMLSDVFEPDTKSQKPLSQGQQERADLINAIGMTEGSVAGGSINYGPLSAKLNDVKSIFNKGDQETLNFKNSVSGLRAAIAKARAGASMSEGERKMLDMYTPKYTDSEQVIQSKLQSLRQLYGYSAPTGGGTTIEDMLMQSQGGYQ